MLKLCLPAYTCAHPSKVVIYINLNLGSVNIDCKGIWNLSYLYVAMNVV